MAFKYKSKLSELGMGPVAKARDFLLNLNAQYHFADFIGAMLLSGFVVLMMRTDSGLNTIPVYKVGDVAQRTVRVNNAIEIQDAESTEMEKMQVLSRVPDVYDFDSDGVRGWVNRWKVAVTWARARPPHENPGAAAKIFSDKLGAHVSGDEYRMLREIGFSSDLERSASYSFGPLWYQKIVETKDAEQDIEVVDLRTNRSEFMRAKDLNTGLLTIEEARSLLGHTAESDMRNSRAVGWMPWSRWKGEAKKAVFDVQSRLVKANLTLNRKETESRRDAALKDFRPLIQKLSKGEVIVREGERVSKRAAYLMGELGKKQGLQASMGTVPFEIFFAGFCLWLMLLFLRRVYPSVLSNNKNTLVAGTMLLVWLAAFKLLMIFDIDVLADHFLGVPLTFFIFLIPVSAPAMILRLLMGSPLTIVFSALYGVGAALFMDRAAFFGLHATISCLAGAVFLRHCRTRSELYRAGVLTAFVCAISAGALILAWGGELPISGSLTGGAGIEQGFSPQRLAFFAMLGGFIAGWLSSAITLVITPILENILDYTTDLKLLELARMDHPLMKDLVLKAPGTYHHCIIVGSLAEAGAEAIGANALLARVGAYYHDIGKIARADYFIENLTGGANRHDTMNPQLSGKIILSHVKEGVELARQYRLGQQLIDFIEQHHGTSLVSYFYNKAKQRASQPETGLSPNDVREEEFRYPGPKPQYRETAIMALADSCEAATRSLVDPTPARIEGMVKKIINKAYSEGLLEEANITLKEVNQVGRSFVRILLGIHHNRIQYPDQEKDLPPSNLALVKGGKGS